MKSKGLLLAVSSLPGKYGIGDFSSCATEFVNILKENKIDIWQILPLNPIGYGHSPYQPYSSYAFDEIYVDIEDLISKSLIKPHYFSEIPASFKTDYETARSIKEKAIYLAFEEFKKNKVNLNKLRKFMKKNPYAEEFAEFITLKELNDGRAWNEWKRFQKDVPSDFEYLKNKHAFAQMILFEQWHKIKSYANACGIKIIGDLPFYVGYDSSDLYFHKESYLLDEKYNPTKIAGVPPDYFSEFGQRWGNPIYDWDYLAKHKYITLNSRISFASKLYDIVRLDHFRAFDSYWAINPSCPTAVDGEWCYPDGYKFFRQLYRRIRGVNLIAEDLGELRDEVIKLKDYFKLAGMRVLEFSFFEDEFTDKRNEKENQIYYLTTHDNETLLQWTNALNEYDKNRMFERVKEPLKTDEIGNYALIRYALKRRENTVIISVSDLLNLDERYRMNKPGIIDNDNWTFKLDGFEKLRQSLEELKIKEY